MISTHQADCLVREHAPFWQQKRLPLAKAHGHHLAESLCADRDGPPFDRVAMDGIAISQNDFEQFGRVFKLEALQAAGESQKQKSEMRGCLEAMTGAVLPLGCDQVIPFEKCLKIDDEHYELDPNIEPKVWLNIHRQACDFKAGDVLLHAKQKLRAPEIAVAASLGCTHPLVYLPPSIAIITTGSELVDVHETPLPHQIRKSNLHAATAMLEHHGFDDLHHYHIHDELHNTIEKLEQCLQRHDILILSGGVSKGKLDFVPAALAHLKVVKVFHSIAQKPGKPMWFGTKEDKCVYALPGNPVSLLVCLNRYVIPALFERVSPKRPALNYVQLKETIKAKPNLSLFCPVVLENSNAHTKLATPISNHGSGDYAALTLSSGFVELEARESPYVMGDYVPYYDWENP